jgi:hypothetical protein
MRAKKKRQTDEVENALFRRAVGYTFDEATIQPDEDGERVTKIVRKAVAPCIQAQILWLRAYRPEIWGKSSANENSDDETAELYRALDRASRTSTDRADGFAYELTDKSARGFTDKRAWETSGDFGDEHTWESADEFADERVWESADEFADRSTEAEA